MNTDEYVVRFWITNEEGYRQQISESVFLNGKNKHKQAEKFILTKWRKKPYYQEDIDVVSVVYQ